MMKTTTKQCETVIKVMKKHLDLDPILRDNPLIVSRLGVCLACEKLIFSGCTDCSPCSQPLVKWTKKIIYGSCSRLSFYIENGEKVMLSSHIAEPNAGIHEALTIPGVGEVKTSPIEIPKKPGLYWSLVRQHTLPQQMRRGPPGMPSHSPPTLQHNPAEAKPGDEYNAVVAVWWGPSKPLFDVFLLDKLQPDNLQSPWSEKDFIIFGPAIEIPAVVQLDND